MMDKLLMQVALIDQVTKPLQGITQQMQSTVDAGRQGMANMATGGAGLIAAGFAIQSALMPAIEMDRKLGEVASLRVTDEALKQLQTTALEFSVEYGKSATDFVEASYDIKSAMGDLSADELSNLTKITGITAAATKANTKEIASYFGIMNSVFEESSNSMGKVAWAEQLSGYTSLAVDKFMTDGPKLSQAFKTLGNIATKEGVSLAEQFAVLGTLGNEMDGSVAATKYQAFISKAAEAGEKLGLNFLDSNNNLLDTASILNEIRNKYGDLDSLEKMEITKAFGGKEAMSFVSTLYDKTGALAGTIEQFSELNGMDNSVFMAKKMTDQWERLEAQFFAVRASVFGAILPAINTVVGSMVDGMSVITVWVDEFPILGEILGYVAIAGISLGGVVAALSLAMGIGQMMSAGWALTMGALNGVFKMLRIQTILATASAWLFNAALWANPITWVVAGIVGLVAIVGAAIYWWDDLKASFGDTAVFKFLADTIDWVIDKLNMIPGVDIDFKAGAMPTAPEVAAMQASAGELVQTSTDSIAVAPYKQPQNKTPLPYNMVQNASTGYNKYGTTNTRTYGNVTINAPQGMTPDQLAEWEELNAG